MKTILAITAILSLIASPTFAAAPKLCFEYPKIIKKLKKDNYTPVVFGIVGDGNSIIEIWQNDERKWLQLQTLVSGSACIVSAGTALTTQPRNVCKYGDNCA